jgi:UDP-N-acetylmuramoyl-tripeptide--D-alanyl-D-alanine ligase
MGIPTRIIHQIASTYHGTFSSEEEWTVFTNSRQVYPNGFFIPIIGERFDGHDFIKDVIQSGAKGAFWQKDHPIPEGLPSNFALFFVEDTLLALQHLSERYLEWVNPKVVAITGSNGKTTTKDLVEALVKETYPTHKTGGNFNNHIGVPLTILEMPQTTKVLILEMGMNHFGEIERLSKIANPDMAIITNIGESHIEFLGSRAGIAKAKLEITAGMEDGFLVIDGDEPLLTEASVSQPTFKVGYSSDCDWVITSVETKEKGTAFHLNGAVYDMPLHGKHNVKNVALALAIADRLGVPNEICHRALKQLKITGMRFEVLKGQKQTRLINDAYNSSPTSMKAAIETVKSFKGYKVVGLVLGDMYELGPTEKALHREVAEVIEPPITHLITIGSKGQWISDEVKARGKAIHVTSFLTKEEALPYLETLLGADSLLLFKASRGMKLETLVNELREKGDL